MSDIKTLQQKIVKFRDDRDWKQFHNPKDISLSLMLEAAELIEHFQWKNPQEVEEYSKKAKGKIAEEIADITKYLLLLAYDLKLDISKIVLAKMRQDGKKYPVSKAKGTAKKYIDL